jgi:hypothetical protein
MQYVDSVIKLNIPIGQWDYCIETLHVSVMVDHPQVCTYTVYKLYTFVWNTVHRADGVTEDESDLFPILKTEYNEFLMTMQR